MSNTRQLGGPVIPSGDMGLGFCLACLSAYRRTLDRGDSAPSRMSPPRFAITLAPSMVPIMGPGGVVGTMAVPVPACWDHLGGLEQEHGPLLVVPS